MKEKLLVIVPILLVSVFGIMFVERNQYTVDEQAFRNEYMSINNKKIHGKKALSIDVMKDNDIEYLQENNVVEKLKKGKSIIFFGFPECPWCRSIVPVLLDVNKEYNTTLYYFNAKKIRDEKHLDKKGKIVVDRKGTKEYKEIIKILDKYLDPYEGLNDKKIKRLYFPTVVFVKDGEVQDIHIGTIPSQKDPYKKLTTKQKEELIESLEKKYDKVFASYCEQNTKC